MGKLQQEYRKLQELLVFKLSIHILLLKKSLSHLNKSLLHLFCIIIGKKGFRPTLHNPDIILKNLEVSFGI